MPAQTCGPEYGFRRPGVTSGRREGGREIARWAVGAAGGCPLASFAPVTPLTTVTADPECYRVARAFVAAALRLGSAAARPSQGRP
jgi:hypothetical protein